MKRFISVFLCAIMLCGSILLDVYAADPADAYDLGAYGQEHFYTGLAVSASSTPDGVVSDREYTASLGSYTLANDASDDSFIVIDGTGDVESFSIYASYDANYIYFATVVKNIDGNAPTNGETILYLGDTSDITANKTIELTYASGTVSHKSGSSYLDTAKTAAVIDNDACTMTFEFAVDRTKIESLEKYFVRFYFGLYEGTAKSGSANFAFSHTSAITVGGTTLAAERRHPHVLCLAVDQYRLEYYGQKRYTSPMAQNPVHIDGVIDEGEYAALNESTVAGMSSWQNNGDLVIADSVGNAQSVGFYSSYDSAYIYFAVTITNTDGNDQKYGKLLVYLGDDSDMSVHDDTTIKYNDGTVSLSSSVVSSETCQVLAGGETLTYELAVDRTKITAADEYFLRMTLYMYDGTATSADTVTGSCNFAFYSPTLQSNGFSSGATNRFPHVLALGTNTVAGGKVEYTGGHNLTEYGQKQYYVGDGTTATAVDGAILDGEYPLAIKGMTIDASGNVSDDAFFVSEGADSITGMNIYANHDAENFYFAFEVSDKYPKNNDFYYFNIGVIDNATNGYIQIYMPYYGGGEAIEMWHWKDGSRGANYASTLLNSSKMTLSDGVITYEISVKRDALESLAGKEINKIYFSSDIVIQNDETGEHDGPQLWFAFKSDELKADGTHAPMNNNNNYYPHVFFYGDKADYEEFFTEDCGVSYTACAHTSYSYVNYDTTDHVQICDACGYMTTSEAHGYGQGVVTKAATDTQTGIMTYTCATCSLTKIETIAIDESTHSYGVALNYSTTQHKRRCACGDVIYEPHEWGDGEIVLEATATNDGVTLYTCGVCGATKQEISRSVVLAADTSQSIEIQGEYVSVPSGDVISVDLSWTTPEFTYMSGEKLWNPESHTYDTEAGGWKASEKLDITIKNHSNVGVEATLVWNGTLSSIDGTFENVDENGKVELLTAEATEYDAAPSSVVTFKISGDPISEDTSLGSISITIKKADDGSSAPSVPDDDDTPDVVYIPDSTDRFVYDHVLILGLDGIGNFRTLTDTPNIDSIFAEGAITDIAQTSLPSATGPCWSSMFTGVTPEAMGVSSNPDASTPDVNATYTAVQENYPSIFSMTRAKYADADIVSISAWNQMNDYVIGNNDGVTKINTDGSDVDVRNKAIEYINGDMPELMFLHFDSADALGHVNGYASNIYLAAITALDGYVGDIYKALEENGLLENTLIILATDHGGTEKTHGGDTEAEILITLGFKGSSVLPIKQFDMTIRDVAVVIAHALDLGESEKWTDVEVPDFLFSDDLIPQ